MSSRTTDAVRGVKFNITSRDVRRAKAKDPENCAAALALKRRFGADRVEVHASRIYVEVGRRRLRFATPQALKVETVVLDRGGKFEPGEYKLGLVPRSQKTEAMRRRNQARRRSTGRPRRRRAVPGVRKTARQ